jgi:hypothetical protein
MVRDWVTQIRLRKLALPEFQRSEAWGPRTVTSLLTSIVRGLPVGVCLVLEVGNKPQFHSKYFAGVPESGENPKELLLDGQQRLTAVWRSLIDNYADRVFLLDLDTEEDEDISAIGQSRWESDGRRYPLWVDAPKDCWSKKKIPFRILNPDNPDEFLDWVKQASDGNATKYDELLKLVIDMRNRVANFNIPYLYLPPETAPHVAVDVFIKMNTSYVRLSAFDIIVAQVQEATDQSLHQKVKELENDAPEIRDYIETSDYVLSVASLLQDKLPSQRGYFALNLEKMIADWPRIIQGTKSLIEMLEEQHIFDSERLPTETILAPVAAIFAGAPSDPDKLGNIRLLLRRYMWRSFFTERYERSIPTRILQDFRALNKVVVGEADVNTVPIFDDTQFPLPNEELIEAAGWPKKTDRLARAILLLSLRKGAIDFADSSYVNRKNIRVREYHHLFPDHFLKLQGLNEEQSFRALNCALVTWKTNRLISDKPPLEYLLARANASTMGEAEIKNRLVTHMVDYDALKTGNYGKFLQDRAATMKAEMGRLCSGIT